MRKLLYSLLLLGCLATGVTACSDDDMDYVDATMQQIQQTDYFARNVYAPNLYRNGAPVDHIALGYTSGAYIEKFERPFLIAMNGGTMAYCFNFNYLERMEFVQTTAPDLDNQEVTVINLYFSK